MSEISKSDSAAEKREIRKIEDELRKYGWKPREEFPGGEKRWQEFFGEDDEK